MKIVCTAVLTTLGSVFVFVMGQIVQRLFVEPIQEQRRLLGKAAHAATFYANVSSRPGLVTPATPDDAVKAVRGLAADLLATLSTIPVYRWLERCRVVRPRVDIEVISRNLIGFSNTFHSSADRHDSIRHDCLQEIQARLRLITKDPSAEKAA